MLNKKAIAKECERGSIFVQNAEDNFGENFIEVTLGDTILTYDTPALYVDKASPCIETKIPEEGLILKPGELYIGRTDEITLTYGFVPLLQGTSNLAALGMEAHITAGFGDNGFQGTWTLEIVCSLPTIIYPHMTIGYISYNPVVGDPGMVYKGKYAGQIKPTPSRLSEEYDMTRKREK